MIDDLPVVENKIVLSKLMEFASLHNYFRNMICKKWNDLQRKAFHPTDSSSLAVFRILFGITMFFDIPDERGLSFLKSRWDNEKCQFPLIHSLKPLPYNLMCILYLIMWLGTIGITFGYKFHTSCLAFTIPFWYIILLDKIAWNNHTYLFGLIGILLYFTHANVCWSLDQWMNRCNVKNSKVPMWNYAILRYQVFILYFMAGVKKLNLDWLGGYSMINLSEHMVFKPFRLLLTPDKVDYWIVHVTGFLIDGLSGFGLCFRKTRPITFIILFLFHLMNSRLFAIGMFPYVGIVTMFIFCSTNWPRKLIRKFVKSSVLEQNVFPPTTVKKSASSEPLLLTIKQNITMCCIFTYIILQLILPFSHFITKGYNGWTNGQYGYSWDMMVNNWDISQIRVTLVDNNNNEELFIDSTDLVANKKWIKHPDMIVQYANCVKDRLTAQNDQLNISMYIDAWSSLNQRLYQRMIDPTVDIFRVRWSPFTKPKWIMPLLISLTDWRNKLSRIRNHIYSESNVTDVIFVSDFPGMQLENYVSNEFGDVVLKVLDGKIKLDLENRIFQPNDEVKIPSGITHKVHTISDHPSCYMYLYTNVTLMYPNITQQQTDTSTKKKRLELNLYKDFKYRMKTITKSISIIHLALLQLAGDISFAFF